MDIEPYDPGLAPAPFGLANTGATCYLNAFLQALASCTAFTRAVLGNGPYMGRTATGAAVYAYVAAYAAADAKGGRALAAPQCEMASAGILRALVADLAARRPSVRFGGGQESASEALHHILDMLEPPPAAERAGAPLTGPIARLFLHRYRSTGICSQCRAVVSTTEDYAVNINLFHLTAAHDTPATFSEAVRRHETVVPDYACEACARTAAAAGVTPQRTQLVSIRRLTMAPELLVCAFNIYAEHRAHYFPGQLEFPAEGGGRLGYRLVAQVEHAGALTGGHYWARGLRREDGPDGPRLRPYELNDSSVGAAAFGPAPSTYLVFYHCTGLAPGTTARAT